MGFGDFIGEDVLKEKADDVAIKLDVKRNPERQNDKVAGVNEALPFKKEAFDLVLGAYASFAYLEKII